MDALAGYGSDSSSASSVENSGSNPTETGQSSGNDKLLKANVCGSRALSGLLHYSDNEVDERTEPQQVGNSESGQQGKESGDSEADRTYSVIGVAVSTDEFPPLKKKRPRRWDNPSAEEPTEGKKSVGPPYLPPPRLSGDSTSAFASMIEFDRDYTISLRTKKFVSVSNPGLRALAEKLDRMRGAYAPSFAAHLRTQHEFGNPHTFPSVVSHCNIDPVGTNLDASLWDPNNFRNFEFSDRLIRAEEQSRIRAAEAAEKTKMAEKQCAGNVTLHLKMAMGGDIKGVGLIGDQP